MKTGSLSAALAATLLLAGCTERAGLVAPPPAEEAPSHRITAQVRCEASVAAAAIACATLGPVNGAGLIIGGQGQYVQLTSGNLVMSADTFAFDVTVQNLIHQAMGTQDGTTPHADGVRVFFNQVPTTTAGSGTVAIVNADGTDTFLSAGQPYYQYDGILEYLEVSPVRQWRFTLDPAVETFVFTLYVSTEIQYTGQWVDLAASPGNLLEGESFTLSGVVRDRVGNPASGTILWSSSDTLLATVDGSGQVTAVAPGQVTITATVAGTGSEASIDICPSLAVGEVYIADGTAASWSCLAGGASGAEYTFMPLNLSTSASLSLTTLASNIVAVTGPPSPALLPAPRAAQIGTIAEGGMLTDDGLHLRIRTADAARTASLASTPASRIRRTAVGGPRFNIVPGVPSVGDLWTLNVAQGCSGARDERVGQVRTISNRLIIVADTANPAGGFTTAQYDSIALEFDTIAYQAVTPAFGEPTDEDSNGRVVAFFTRAVNELSPPASSVVNHGYFTTRDVFSSDPVNGCERSNAGEIIYMLVPDPTGAVNSNVRQVSFVRGNTSRTLGHELQHLSNAFQRIYGTSQDFEESWLDEGLSRVAEELMFFRTSFGLAPEQNIVLSNLTTGPNASRRVAAFNTYLNPNFGQLRPWLQRPDTTAALRDNSTLAAQGALWAFLRYSADRAAGSDTASQNLFWNGLIDNGLRGRANLEAAIGGELNGWLVDFTAGMYGDDAVAGVGSQHTNPSYNFRSIFGGLGGYPLTPRPLTNNVGLTLSYARAGGTAYARFRVAGGEFATVTALSGGVPPASPFRVAVMRSR